MTELIHARALRDGRLVCDRAPSSGPTDFGLAVQSATSRRTNARNAHSVAGTA